MTARIMSFDITEPMRAYLLEVGAPLRECQCNDCCRIGPREDPKAAEEEQRPKDHAGHPEEDA